MFFFNMSICILFSFRLTLWGHLTQWKYEMALAFTPESGNRVRYGLSETFVSWSQFLVALGPYKRLLQIPSYLQWVYEA